MKRPSLILSERSFKEMLSDIFGKVFQEAYCSYSHWAKKPLKLRYRSSTLVLYKELSSTIFQSCQSVSLSGMRDTLPNLHFLQYIKA